MHIYKFWVTGSRGFDNSEIKFYGDEWKITEDEEEEEKRVNNWVEEWYDRNCPGYHENVILPRLKFGGIY